MFGGFYDVDNSLINPPENENLVGTDRRIKFAAGDASFISGRTIELRCIFSGLWKYINTYFIDNQHVGWYDLGIDHCPEAEFADKGHIWKTNYHDARAMIHSLSLLQSNSSLFADKTK